MLHWLVLCRFGAVDTPSPEFWPDEYLSRTSIAVHNEETLAWKAETGEEITDVESPNPVDWLRQHGSGILVGLRRP